MVLHLTAATARPPARHHEPRALLPAGLGLQERTMQAGGTPTTVLEGGEGDPLILLHGGFECGGAVWAPVPARLAGRRRVVVPDLPGLGDPEWFAAFSGGAVACARVPHVRATMRQLVAAGTQRVPDQELRRIPVRVDLLWGRHDRFVPLRVAEAASARLGLPLHVLEAAGHAAHLDRPDAFAAALHRLEEAGP